MQMRWLALAAGLVIMSGCADRDDAVSAAALSAQQFSAALDHGDIATAYGMLTPNWITVDGFAETIALTRAMMGACEPRPEEFRFERTRGPTGDFVTIQVRRECARGWMQEWVQMKIDEPTPAIAGFGFTGPGIDHS